MKRLSYYFFLCCGIASLTPAVLAGFPETNSTGTNEFAAAQVVTNQVSTNQPAPAAANSAPVTATNQPMLAVTNTAPATMTNETAPVATDTAPVTVTNQPASATTNVALAATTNQPPSADTNSSKVTVTNEPAPNADFEISLELARQQRRSQTFVSAAQILEDLLKTNAPPAIQRQALFELALVMQDDGQMARAQQIWSQYLHVYSDDPTIPDVLLRQGLLYRKMGVNAFAISKFYAVMSSALKLKLDNLAYYKKLVVQAQIEIADTYFLDAKFDEAADFFNRILKSGDGEANREQLEWKLIRSLSYLTNHVETIGKAQSFLTRFPKSSNVPEIRFLLGSALQRIGRNSDAMEQVLLLLQSQQENVNKDPESWAYWQRRAGNEIANQLYKEGDYIDALEIYRSLAELDKSPVWQVPVWYQIGMVYEQLQQWQKATDTYTRILDRQKELTDANNTPTLASLMEMAKWRKDYIAWMQQAKLKDLALRPEQSTNTPAVVAP